jgi:hypothetical protein
MILYDIIYKMGDNINNVYNFENKITDEQLEKLLKAFGNMPLDKKTQLIEEIGKHDIIINNNNNNNNNNKNDYLTSK